MWLHPFVSTLKFLSRPLRAVGTRHPRPTRHACVMDAGTVSPPRWSSWRCPCRPSPSVADVATRQCPSSARAPPRLALPSRRPCCAGRGGGGRRPLSPCAARGLPIRCPIIQIMNFSIALESFSKYSISQTRHLFGSTLTYFLAGSRWTRHDLGIARTRRTHIGAEK